MILPEVVTFIYNQFEGITWYVQKMLHVLYNMTPLKGVCSMGMVDEALKSVIESYRYTYSEILFRLRKSKKNFDCYHERGKGY